MSNSKVIPEGLVEEDNIEATTKLGSLINREEH
jgi:hypothetical protein